MKCQLVFLLGVFIKISSAISTSEDSETIVEGYLLCKSCGDDTSVLNLIDNSRLSNLRLGISNITIGKRDVVTQDLRNPRGIVFKVVISQRAHCAKTTAWFSDSTWFEGFAWKVCHCPTCKAHLGWMFEPIDLAVNNPDYPSAQGFYAIILDTVISEAYANSLLIVDKVLQN